MKKIILMFFWSLIITSMAFSQNAKSTGLNPSTKELNAFLIGKWQGFENGAKGEYGNVNDHNNGTGSPVNVDVKLTLEFKEIENAAKLSLNYIYEVTSKDVYGGMKSEAKTEYTIIDKSTFKFMYYGDEKEATVICKINKEGIYIKKFNMQLKKVPVSNN